MKLQYIIPICCLFLVAFTPILMEEEAPFLLENASSVAEVLEELGDEPMPHKPNLSIAGVSAERGAEIVHLGVTSKPKGGKTSKQSKHFVCTSCHNTVKEDPDLRISDPEKRLDYAVENNLPFLQGTTLYGVVNRSSFYNGDYEKKYGSLVEKARNDLREAIQLCALECSQGRALEDWEMESVMSYLWTIDLKIGDLGLNEQEKSSIQQSVNSGGSQTAIDLIRSRYLAGSPATFITPPDNRKEGFDLKTDTENGKLIYELSCLYCHEDQRFAFFELDDTRYTFEYLKKHFPKYTRYSVYQVTRWGTSPIEGKKAYMPNYTLEKMSNQQLEDLKAYIYKMAKRNPG